MDITSDSDWHRKASCEGKEQFTAQRVAEVRRRYPKADSYRCKHCGFFHLGHKKPSKRKMKNR